MADKLLSELAKGTWSSLTDYTVGDIVDYLSSSYICISNSTNNTPPNGTYWAVLAKGIVAKGAYDNSTDYAVGDSVSYLGSSYIMYVNATAGTLPTDTTKWQVIASKGDTGSQGTQGIQGNIGSNGISFIWKGAWLTSTSYAVDDVVSNGGSSYICLIAHTSGTFATDLGAGKWQLMAQKGTDGAGAGDMLKATYDPQNIAADAFDQDNMTDGTTNKNYSATEKTKLSGIEASADVTDAGNVGSSVNGATAKTSMVDADKIAIIDTEASNILKTLSWAYVKSILKTYFDSIYQAAGSYLTAAGFTLTGEIQDGENAGFRLDDALSADGKYSGIIEAGTAAATLVFGDLCYFVAASSKWNKAKADSATTSSGKLGICVLAASGDAQPTKMLLFGKINAASAFPTLTIGAPVYISGATAGAIVTAQPTTTDYVIRVLGFGNSGDELFFNPSPDYMTHI